MIPGPKCVRLVDPAGQRVDALTGSRKLCLAHMKTIFYHQRSRIYYPLADWDGMTL